MKQLLLMILVLSFLSTGCNSKGSSDSSSDSSTDTSSVVENAPTGQGPTEQDEANESALYPTPATATSSLPLLALSFSTNVEYYNLTDMQEEKYDQAVELVKKVVGTESFRTRVLNHLYNGEKSFANNNGLTNAQIYQSVLDAAEKLTPAKNNQMDVGVKMYYENNSVVGWTSTSITYINVNTKFFNVYDPHEVAGNLFHEWLHKLGYGHDSTATTRRPYSVPYAIGYLIRDIGKNFL
jgi:hypothetical protein